VWDPPPVTYAWTPPHPQRVGTPPMSKFGASPMCSKFGPKGAFRPSCRPGRALSCAPAGVRSTGTGSTPWPKGLVRQREWKGLHGPHRGAPAASLEYAYLWGVPHQRGGLTPRIRGGSGAPLQRGGPETRKIDQNLTSPKWSKMHCTLLLGSNFEFLAILDLTLASKGHQISPRNDPKMIQHGPKA